MDPIRYGPSCANFQITPAVELYENQETLRVSLRASSRKTSNLFSSSSRPERHDFCLNCAAAIG